jgi:DNA-binding NarL/FixJ family response regulator
VLPFAIDAAFPSVLVIDRHPAAAEELCALLQSEGLSTQVLTLEAFGTPDTAAGWMLHLDPVAIIVDIPPAPGSELWSHLLRLWAAATRHRVPFVMTTRSKHVLEVPVGATGVITVTNHDDRKVLAACVARMIVPAPDEDRLEPRAGNHMQITG